jgi:hypothetical protein
VYSALAPGTGATTIATDGAGIVSELCSGTSVTTLNYIPNGDTVSRVQAADDVFPINSSDAEALIVINPGGAGLSVSATIAAGTVDGGNGSVTTYGLAVANGGVPDSPPAGCLVAGTKSAA